MNERTPGPDMQGLVESWGDDCGMQFKQSTDGGRNFPVVAQENHVVSEMADTGFYWNGNGRFAMVCLYDSTARKYGCGQAVGG